MATWEELTDEQRDIVQAYETQLRGEFGTRWQLLCNAFEMLASQYSDVQPILDLLDPGTVIPNSSGLAGSSSLTKEEVASFTATLQGHNNNSNLGANAGYNDLGFQNSRTKAAGLTDIL